MAVNVNINGTSYTIPNTGEEGWGDNVTNWIVAASSFLLQRSGGSFPLSAEVDFGGTAGLRALVFRSKAADVAASGVLRLGNADKVSWRNFANSADLQLGVNASNQLTYDGNAIPSFPGGVLPAANGGTGQSSYAVGDILYADTTTTLAKRNVGAVSTVVLSNGTLPVYGLLSNASIDPAAAIAYSKLNLALSIVNADIAAAAAIARSKLGLGTANHVVINDGTGAFSSEAQLAISRGGTGQSTQTSAFDALAPTTTKGDLPVHNGTDNVRLPVGSNGLVLTANSAQSTGLEWTSVAGGAAIAANAIDASGTFNGGDPIIFPTETFDSNAAYNPATGEYTAPVSGVYEVEGAMVTMAGGAVVIQICVNGTPIVNAGFLSAAVQIGSFSGLVDVAASDVITVETTAGSITLSNGCLSVMYIGS